MFPHTGLQPVDVVLIFISWSSAGSEHTAIVINGRPRLVYNLLIPCHLLRRYQIILLGDRGEQLANFSVYFEHSVVTLKLRKECLNTVIYNTLVLLRIKY